KASRRRPGCAVTSRVRVGAHHQPPDRRTGGAQECYCTGITVRRRAARPRLGEVLKDPEGGMRRSAYPKVLSFVAGSVLLTAGVAAAQGGGIQRFYGTYVGEAVSETGEELDKRDISAEISPEGKGFKIKWTAVIKRGKDKPRREERTVVFL